MHFGCCLLIQVHHLVHTYSIRLHYMFFCLDVINASYRSKAVTLKKKKKKNCRRYSISSLDIKSYDTKIADIIHSSHLDLVLERLFMWVYILYIIIIIIIRIVLLYLFCITEKQVRNSKHVENVKVLACFMRASGWYKAHYHSIKKQRPVPFVKIEVIYAEVTW